MSNKDIALSYLRQGLSVIPLKSPSMVSSNLPQQEFIRQCKMPLVKWKEFQSRLPTEEEVAGWFDQWPYANICIVTGKVSGIVVFDLDSEHAIQYAEDEGGFPDSPAVRTGKGRHVYMRYPGFEVRNDVRKELDIDIRADGGYVAARSFAIGHTAGSADLISSSSIIADSLRAILKPSAETAPFQTSIK